MRKPFRFVAAADGSVEVLIYEQIGQTFWGDGLTARAFREDLAQHAGRKLTVRINSPGGSIFDGLAIYGALVEHDRDQGEVCVIVDGLAASIASIIAMAGREIAMRQGTQLMIHNPWTMLAGDADALRREAAVLDKLRDGMAGIYADRSGEDIDKLKALMADESWFTADEAMALGLADRVESAYTPVPDDDEEDDEDEEARAAHASGAPADLLKLWNLQGVFKHAPAACATGERTLKFNAKGKRKPNSDKTLALLREITALARVSASTQEDEENQMKTYAQLRAEAAAETDPVKKAALLRQAAAHKDAPEVDRPELERQAVALERPAPAKTGIDEEAEMNRRAQIRQAFNPWGDQHRALLDKCLDDMKCTVAEARERLLQALGKATSSVAGGSVITSGEDASDKRRNAMVLSTLQRAGINKDPDDGKQIVFDGANPYRGLSLRELARQCMRDAGRNPDGLSALDVARTMLVRQAAGGQSTSDFPVFLENTLHKLVLAGFQAITPAYPLFCKIGTVTDFRDWRRIVPGMIANLEIVTEGGEYKNKNLPDGKKESIAAKRRGNIIEITPETLVNDDLGAIADTARQIGMAGPRTIDRAVFALLAQNANLGPTMGDGLTLIHATHGNTGTGAPTVAALAVLAQLMAKQKFPGDDAEIMDLQPAVALANTLVGAEIDVVVNSQYDPDTNNKLQRPNKVRGLVKSIAKTERMPATIYYLFADPSIAPVIEVVFLDGQQQVRVVQEENFRTAGLAWRGELNAGVGAIDYRGIVYSTGA